MLNAEKWKKEILEKLNIHNDFAIAEEDKRIKSCASTGCSKCLFNVTEESCTSAMTRWLLSEYKEPVKLTRFEYELLKFWNDKEYKYIARDSNNMVFVYHEKPSKNSKVWGSLHEHRVIDEFDKSFLFVRWEDSTPTSIKDVLDNCEVIEDAEE